MTIRKFRQKRYTIEELIEAGSLTEEMANFLQVQVRDGKTLLISGGTGSGKTTLLNALVDFIPGSERIVVIEDTAELRINNPNVLAAECLVANDAPGIISHGLTSKAGPCAIVLSTMPSTNAFALSSRISITALICWPIVLNEQPTCQSRSPTRRNRSCKPSIL